MLFTTLLPHLVTAGSLRVIDPSGRQHRFGPGGAPDVTVRLHDRALLTRLAVNPALSVGEAYMNGSLTIERGLLADFLHICTIGMEALVRVSRLGEGENFSVPHNLLVLMRAMFLIENALRTLDDAEQPMFLT